MFNLCVLLFGLGFCNIIYATQNIDHESEYNCTIETVDNGVREKIARLLEDGKKVIFLHLVFTNQMHPFLDSYIGDMYKPLDWVRIAGRHGRSLLFLRPEFEQLSLTTLSLETGYIEVSLVQKTENCLMHFNKTFAENKLRDLLLSDFEPAKDGGSLSEHEYICNMHIRNDKSKAQFFYRCCHKGPDGSTVCTNLIYDFWINVVFICAIIISVVAILFSPYLIPVSLYREKYIRGKYEHKLTPLQIKIKQITSDKYLLQGTDGSDIIMITKGNNMDLFNQFVDRISFRKNEWQKFWLDKIHIAVQYRRLIPANYVPLGIIKTFYTLFIKCHIRKSSHFSNCCGASIVGCFTKESRDKTIYNANYPWFTYLKQFMRLFILIGMSLPWIIRILFFYWYEKQYTLQKAKAASERNMTLSLQWNLTYTLTPIHNLFLLCYTIIVIDALVFGVVSHKVKMKLQVSMRKCLREMREMSSSKALAWSASIILYPFEKCGIFGFLIFGIYVVFALPVVFIVLAFYCLPSLNLFLQLFLHCLSYMKNYRNGHKTCKNKASAYSKAFHLFISSDKEYIEHPQRITKKTRCRQLFVFIACLVTVSSVILLIMEIVLFCIEIFIYTIIGIIMNASAMLKYISLIFMLVLYARDCFKGISDKYLEFNKSINRLIVDMVRKKVEKISNLRSYAQKNTVFQVQMDNTEENVNDKVKMEMETGNVKFFYEDGTPKCQIRRLILFLDVNDKPYLPEKFFKTICKMETVGVPGPLIYNLIKATSRFLCICVFLMFVVLIVLAFGDEYEISGTNQMLATLAGGFLPWVFRNVLFKSKDSLKLDTDNLSFKSNLLAEIEDFDQIWDIADIEVNKINTDKDTTNQSNNDEMVITTPTSKQKSIV